MNEQSNHVELASVVGQLTIAECEPFRAEILAAVNAVWADEPFDRSTPMVVLLRAFGRIGHGADRP